MRHNRVPRYSVDGARVAGHHFEEVSGVFVPQVHLNSIGGIKQNSWHVKEFSTEFAGAKSEPPRTKHAFTHRRKTEP